MEATTTEWDDDRILARVETRQSAGDLNLRELVVRLYDCGPADGRAADPKMIYDSERAEGFSGVFQKATKADRFAKRVKAGTLHRMRLGELVKAERQANLTKRLEAKEGVAEEAEAEAKAAKAIAKAAKRAQKKLWREAANPEVQLECRPGGKGYVVTLSPSETNGPRSIVLVSVGEADEPTQLPISLEEIFAATEAAAKGEPEAGAEEAPRKLPDSVPGSSGPKLRPKMRVWVEEPKAEPWVGELLAITRQDDAGAYWVEVSDSAGVVHEVQAAHCRKAKKGEG
jgi:hypothetical protein